MHPRKPQNWVIIHSESRGKLNQDAYMLYTDSDKCLVCLSEGDRYKATLCIVEFHLDFFPKSKLWPTSSCSCYFIYLYVLFIVDLPGKVSDTVELLQQTILSY